MTQHKTGFLIRWSNILILLVLMLVPFHAFLTIWASQLTGHYTLLRLWDELLLIFILGGSLLLLRRDPDARHILKTSPLFRLIAAYAGLTILLGAVALLKHEVTAKALGYSLIVNLRFLIWFGAVWLVARASPRLRRAVPSVFVLPAAAVISFAVLQYTVLPHSFLAHFGYDARTTIAPIETINSNAAYIRVQSTLRGANPLGAYLVIAAAATTAAWFVRTRKTYAAVAAVLTVWALYASGSRSAWIGALLAVAVTVLLSLRTKRARLIFTGGLIGCLVIAAAATALTLKQNTDLQNTLLHTQQNSRVRTGSNSDHVSALVDGLHDIARQPFGDGPGTAGPASEYNAGHAPRIAENYYIQIGQETGWLGIALFVCILVVVARQLYLLRKVSRWSVIAFASLIGISFVNMLSHAWVDNTLAYVWWGVAAIVLGTASSGTSKEPRNEDEI